MTKATSWSVADETRRDRPHLLRRASAKEILVTLLFILFALIFICRARGDENPSPSRETRPVEIVSASATHSASHWCLSLGWRWKIIMRQA